MTREEPLPVLYSFRRCPYAMRARLAVSVSGARVELREVALRNKPQALLMASPKATVPVLVLPGGDVIDQSLDIMRWALERNDPEGWLTPAGVDTDVLHGLISFNDGPFKQHLDRYKYPHRYLHEVPAGSRPTDFSAGHRNAGAQWLSELDGRLALSAGRSWLLASTPSVADMALLPFVRQFAHTDRVWFGAQPWPCLLAWLARFETSSLFEGVMTRHEPWQPQLRG